MIENEGLSLKGEWNVKAYTPGTVSLGESVTVRTTNGWFIGRHLETPPPEFEVAGHNMITATGQTLVCDMLMDAASFDTGLTYHAIGTATTAVASSNTQLTTETKRLAITSKSRSNNILTFATFFTATQCAVSVEEAGLFGHNTASTASNTGVLFNRYLVHVDNASGLYDLDFEYRLTVGS